jgi:hypothetical protein
MRDQKPRLRKFACLAAIAAMLALSGRAAERDLDNLLLVRLPAPPEGRRAPLQVMDVPTGDIETSEVAELSPLTFAVIVSGGTVGINRLEMRKAKYSTFSHSILYPVTPALEIGIYHPHAFGWRDIDHHDRTATLVSDEIAGGRGHICLTNKSMSLKPSIHSSPSVRR